MPTYYDHCETAARKIIAHVGKVINLGVPLGLGKPVGLINAFYRLAAADPSIRLTILTGLTLSRPLLKNELEKRFVEPILDRILQDYEDPLYEKPRELQQLPKNIKVIEFFFAPGVFLHNPPAQQDYISSKYTSVVHDSKPYSVNVYAHQVARSQTNSAQYSLSSNTDLFHEMVTSLKESNFDKKAIVAEVNLNLPFMPGETAVINADSFTDIIDTKHYRALFALPRDELSPQDHLIGLYTSTLIPDDSCLQIGIGKLSNAVANALIMRHKNNATYQELMKELEVSEKFGSTITTNGSLDVFEKGLYASTEMVSDEFIELYKNDILKKRVYDNIGLQKLLNANVINEKISAKTLDALLEAEVISPLLTFSDFQFLHKFGILKAEISYNSGNLILPSGEQIPGDLSLSKTKQKIIANCLGDQLKSGKLMHAGFFIGSRQFYQQLRDLPPTILDQIEMSSVTRTNSVLWSYELSQLQRQRARLINSGMMITLGGGLVSDGLRNIQEVSGVGGQFDFVNMAQQLPQARSIINCRSTRSAKGKANSNIIWDYPNLTIPRYLRDIFITEYGIADCRSKIDAELIKEILNITDSNFQEELLMLAKKYGKLPKNYTIPKQFQQNYAGKVNPIIREFQLKGFCKPYPFGSDLTAEENTLAHILLLLKNSTPLKLSFLILRSLLFFSNSKQYDPYLIRMQLDKPKTIKEFIYKKLLIYVIATRKGI